VMRALTIASSDRRKTVQANQMRPVAQAYR
jgi:hypothetical protein